jgi:hypothetical protein
LQKMLWRMHLEAVLGMLSMGLVERALLCPGSCSHRSPCRAGWHGPGWPAMPGCPQLPAVAPHEVRLGGIALVGVGFGLGGREGASVCQVLRCPVLAVAARASSSCSEGLCCIGWGG